MQEEREMIPVSNLTSVDNNMIVASSKVPASLMLGDLIFEKKYDEALKLGEELLKKDAFSPMLNCNMMVLYYKLRKQDNQNVAKAIECARIAIMKGHNTGYCQQRLSVMLKKQKFYHKALQLCDVVLSDNFKFSAHGCGTKNDFSQRRDFFAQHILKAQDKPEDILFTNEEVNEIFNNSTLLL